MIFSSITKKNIYKHQEQGWNFQQSLLNPIYEKLNQIVRIINPFPQH